MNWGKPVEKPFSFSTLGSVNVDSLKEKLLLLSDRVWQQEDSRKENNFFCFSKTRHIIFRFISGNKNPLQFYSLPIWSVWKPLLMPVMQQAVSSMGFQHSVFPKVMFAKLAAGGEIDEHVDGAGSNLLTHKVHVPLITNPKAVFVSNGDSSHFEVGFAYEVNNIAAHSAANRGDSDRIHLIFEVFEQDSP